MDLDEPLFRRESSRIVAALSRLFGLDRLTMAEDVAQDVFCRALEVWKLRGMPANPSAWLMKAAKNRAIDLLRRERTASNVLLNDDVFASEWTLVPAVNEAFSAEAIQDDQLRMMFSCCDPALSEETQVVLMLRLLCGFGVAEIASAFLSKRAAVEKRIERGKKVLACSKDLFDMSDSELPERLPAVQRALYLLFNEGYHASSEDRLVRVELCREAMRLVKSLLENPMVATPTTYALAALMWLHAARLPARVDENGDLVRLEDQDRSLWDAALIAKGNHFLNRSATGDNLTQYHLEAAIAWVHCSAETSVKTDWQRLVWLYDELLDIQPSPVIALNRAIAIAQANGAESGIAALRAIPQAQRLAPYPYFPAALAELEMRAGNMESAREHFEAAAALARNIRERKFLQSRAAATLSARG